MRARALLVASGLAIVPVVSSLATSDANESVVSTDQVLDARSDGTDAPHGVYVGHTAPDGPSRVVSFTDRDTRILSEATGASVFREVALSQVANAVAVTVFDAEMGSSELRILDLGTGASERAVQSSKGVFSPVWSPDGMSLAYAVGEANGSSAVHILDLQTGTDRVLVTPEDYVVERDFACSLNPAPSTLAPADWNPSGELVALQAQYPCGEVIFSDVIAVAIGSGTITVMDARVGGPEAEPQWSPDGEVLAASTASGVEVFGRDGASERLIERGRRPQWAGEALYYVVDVNRDGQSAERVDKTTRGRDRGSAPQTVVGNGDGDAATSALTEVYVSADSSRSAVLGLIVDRHGPSLMELSDSGNLPISSPTELVVDVDVR